MLFLLCQTFIQRIRTLIYCLCLVFFTGALLFESTAPSHASCYVNSDYTITGRHNFFIQDNEGQLAWYKSGKPNKLHLIGANNMGCYTITPPNSGSIKFIANNVTERNEKDETHAFLGVQIIRVFNTNNGNSVIRVMRMGQWRDMNGESIGSFRSRTVPEMDWDTFKTLHDSRPFDSGSIQLGRNRIWHGSPIGGVLSSFDYPTEWISNFAAQRSADIQVTNKLIRFALNSGHGRVGIPFDVETHGAREVYVSVFSPDRNPFTHFIKIIPGN